MPRSSEPSEVSIDVQRLAHGADLPLPSYATPSSAGIDLMAAVDEPGVIDHPEPGWPDDGAQQNIGHQEGLAGVQSNRRQ